MEPGPSTSFEWAQSYKAEPTKTSFLDLPKEIRDNIYDLAWRVSGAILVQGLYIFSSGQELRGRIVRYKGQGPSEPQLPSTTIPIGLLRTCRQLHAESTTVLYGRNVFFFPMGNTQFATFYRPLFRHIVFSMEAGRGIYSHDIEVMGYWWRRVFYPNVIERSTKLLMWYPNLETLTLPIKSDEPGGTWKPVFMMAEKKTSKQRIAMGARWLKANCPMGDERSREILGLGERLDNAINLEERLRQVLHLEVQVPSTNSLTREDFIGSKFAFEDDEIEEWDHTEFAKAFREARGVGS